MTTQKKIFLFLSFFLFLPLAQAKTLRVRAFAEPQTIDWNRASSWVEGFVIRNIMEGLVSIDSNLQAVPACAEFWNVSADHKIYTFTLKKNLKWSDGVPLKAAHFIDSWQRLLTPSTKAKYASLLFDIEGAEAYAKADHTDFKKVGIRAVDDYTIEVKLKAPISYWHWLTSFYATFPIRKDLIKQYDLDWTLPQNLASIGPFLLSSREFGRKIVLKSNKLYSLAVPSNIDEIEMAMVPDDSVALKMFQSGQFDFLSKIPASKRLRLKGRSDFHSWADLRTLHLRLNTSKNPMSNIKLRRAISQAIDHSKLKKIFNDAYVPATSFVPPGLLGHGKKVGPVFNVEKAKSDLKHAGFDASKMPPLDLLTVAYEDQIILAQFIKEELNRNLGLNVRIHILEPKRYYSSSLNQGDYDMQINFWGADYPDSDNFFSIFLSHSGLNKYKWSNADYDKQIIAARSLADKQEREKLYLSAQKILLEQEVATIPLYYGAIDGLISTRVRGFNPGPLNWWAFKGLSFKGK